MVQLGRDNTGSKSESSHNDRAYQEKESLRNFMPQATLPTCIDLSKAQFGPP
jgi:hypothetical protein